MESFIANLASQFDEKTVTAAAERLGIAPETARAAFDLAVPAATAALSAKAAQPDGAASLTRTFGTLTSMGSSRPATLLSGLLHDPAAQRAGNNMARSLLGAQYPMAVENLVARTGITDETAGAVLGMVVPAVMGAVGSQVKVDGTDAVGLAAFLNAESAGAQQEIAGEATSASEPTATETEESIEPSAIPLLAGKLGLPEATVQQLAPTVLGLVLTSLHRTARQPDGVKQIGALIDRAGQAGLMHMSAAEYVKQAGPETNSALLGSIIGSNTPENVADNFARKKGVSAEQAAGLLGIGVPLALGQIGRQQASLGIDTDGLAKHIAEKVAGFKHPGELNYILDNVPGISDNVKRGLKRLFGRG